MLFEWCALNLGQFDSWKLTRQKFERNDQSVSICSGIVVMYGLDRAFPWKVEARNLRLTLPSSSNVTSKEKCFPSCIWAKRKRKRKSKEKKICCNLLWVSCAEKNCAVNERKEETIAHSWLKELDREVWCRGRVMDEQDKLLKFLVNLLWFREPDCWLNYRQQTRYGPEWERQQQSDLDLHDSLSHPAASTRSAKGSNPRCRR